ncbi:MAG: SpoIIE family protein phosphatase [bacterium]|nr:SpoIIE family protein phosphatase [bacterium]
MKLLRKKDSPRETNETTGKKRLFSRSFIITTLLWIVLLCYFLMICSPGSFKKNSPVAEKGVLDLTGWDLEKNGPFRLKGEWEFHWKQFISPTDPPENNLPAYCSVPESWSSCKPGGKELPKTGYASYRLVILPDSKRDKTKPLAIKFGLIGTAFDVYVNGKKISSVGEIGNSPEASIPAYYPHVSDFISGSDRLEVVFHISNFHHKNGGIWEQVWFGKEEDIRRVRVSRLNLELFLFGSILIMALYHLGLFILRRNDRSPLYFGIFCSFMACFVLVTGEQYFTLLFPRAPWELMLKLEYLSYYLCVPVFSNFIQSLYPREVIKKLLRSVEIVSYIFAAIVLISPAAIYSETYLYFDIIIISCCLYVVFVLIVSIIRKRDGAAVFLMGFIIFFITILYDILQDYEIIKGRNIAPFGFFIFIFSQAYLLSIRFSSAFFCVETLSEELKEKSEQLEDANVQLTDLNQTLEDKVLKRTEQLLMAKEEVEATMEELTAMNSNLVSVNRDLEDAYRTIENDMDMAVNVQTALFPKEPPEVKEWDIAFDFRPMIGVSGDFYDFYCSGNTLEGIGLFDVSGHGISSALVTMIAKSILFRIFNENRDKKINEVLSLSNTELIKELGNVDNYLTGIFLRIFDDHIDYVNAAHPDLLHKKGKTGSVDIVGESNFDFRGTFLSIPDMESEFGILSFPVEKEDSILFFTDGLTEGYNNNNDPYEIERLIEVFARIPAYATAREQLDIIMNDYYRYVGRTDKLDDDLTVIILKRTSS